MIMKQLDQMIKERVGYDEDTRENESSYLQLRDEVNECKLVSAYGQLEIDQLSPIAQDVVREWESWVEDYANRQVINHAEAPEDF